MRRKSLTIVFGKSGAGIPVSTCTMGAIERRICEIFCSNSGERRERRILSFRRLCAMVDVGLFALLIPLVELMGWVCMSSVVVTGAVQV